MEKNIKILKSWISKKVVLLPVLFLSVMLIIASAYWFIKQEKMLRDDYTKHSKIIKEEEQFSDIIYYIQRLESDIRGLIITRNVNFVSDFSKMNDSLIFKYEQIVKVYQTTPGTQNPELIKRYDMVVQRKLAHLQQVKAYCDSKNWQAAGALIDSDKGMYLSDSIYALTQLKNKDLQTFTKRSTAHFNKIKQRNVVLAYLGIGLSVVLLILVVYFLRRQLLINARLTQTMHAEREFFKTTVESLGEGLIAANQKGEIVFMNQAAEKFTGWTFNEAKHQPLSTVYRVYNEETGLPFNNIINRIYEAGKVVELENNTLLKSKNDDYLVISNSGAPIKDEKGNMTGAVLIFNDITEKKRNEDELIESERQFRTLIEDLPEAIYTCDELGYIQLYNKAAVKLWGREPLAGKELWTGSWKIQHLDGTELTPETSPMAIALKEGRKVVGSELLILRPDGSVRHVLPTPTPLYNSEGKISGAVNMLLDVTDKKEREILIKITEEKYRNLFEQGNDAIVTFSFDGTIYEYNDIICTMSGYTREEFGKLKLSDVIIGDLIMSTEKYNKVLDGEMVTILRQCRKKDGSAVDMEFKAKMNSEGIMVAFGRDITERKKNEEKIKAAIERFEILSRATSDTVWDWKIKEQSITYNMGIVNIFGYSVDRIHSNDSWWKENIHPDDLEQILNQMEELFASKGQNVQLEYRYCCADGSYKNIKDRAFVIYDADDSPHRMVGAMEDITSEKDHDRLIALTVIETQENERRELGMELHDNVNQLLSATLLYLGVAVRSGKSVAELAETLKGCISYINLAISDIRNLSHRLSPQASEKVSLKEIIQWVVEPMNKTSELDITLLIDDKADDVIAKDVKTNLYRIIQEQLHNIIKHSGAKKVTISLQVTDTLVSLTIEDDGIGFNPELIKNGIGLQNIKRRAEIFFGSFSLITASGKGCKIVIEQPLAKAK